MRSFETARRLSRIVSDTGAPDAVAGESRAERADTALLFVHGIGQQERGAALRQCGEPLLAWLEEWLAVSDDPPAPGIGMERMEVSLREGSGPAFARFEVGIPTQPGSDPREATVLMAESRWSDVFYPPGLLQFLPWTGRFGLKSIYRTWRRFDSSARTLPTGFDQAVGAGADGGERDESATGDQPEHESLPATLASIGRDAGKVYVFTYLQLAIVALSVVLIVIGGTALIVAMVMLPLVLAGLLIASFVRPLKEPTRHLTTGLLASLGDAQVFLTQRLSREAMCTQFTHDLAWASEAASHVVVVAHSQGSAIVHQALLHDPTAASEVSRLITVGNALDLLGTTTRGEDGQPVVAVPAQVNGSEVPWDDYWAVMDLVPNGGIASGSSAFTSSQVVNANSVMNDHSAYFDNGEQFLSAVWEAVLAAGGLSIEVQPGDNEVLEQARRLRPRRIEVVTTARFSFAVAVIAMALHLQRPLGSAARAITGWAESAVEQFPKVLSSVGTHIVSSDVARWFVAVALVLVAGVALDRLIVRSVAQRWDRHCRQRMMRRASNLVGVGYGRALMTIVLAAWCVSLTLGFIAGTAGLATWELGATFVFTLVVFVSVEDVKRSSAADERVLRQTE